MSHSGRRIPASPLFWPLWLCAAGALTALAAATTRGYKLPSDERLTFAVQGLSRFAWADPLFAVANDLGAYEVVAGALLAAIGVLLLRHLRFEALIVAGAGAAHYVQAGIREIVHRPDAVAIQVPGRLYPGPHGFPSGHVFGEVLVYGLIFAYAGRAIPNRGIVWLVRGACAAEIAVGGPARMYTGAHWAIDVAGAMLLAALYLLLAWRLDAPIRLLREAASELGGSGKRQTRSQRRWLRPARDREIPAYAHANHASAHTTEGGHTSPATEAGTSLTLSR
jgi:membrane-associated phospholipid phosphatase